MSNVKKRLRRPQPRKPVTPHRRLMQAAYTEFYRRRLQQNGVPCRRTVAEAVMSTIIRCSCDSEPSADRSFARQILRRSGLDMLTMLDHNGENRFTKAGILKRWKALAAELDQ